MKIAKPASAYRELLNQFELDLGLTEKQTLALENEQPILLSKEQIDFIIDQMSALEGLEKLLTNLSESITPLSLSLFVLNDRLWKMMERKSWDTDKMLAMSTIPLCEWDKNSEKTSNPKAVKRWTVHPNTLEFAFDKIPLLRIDGEGGDFSGFIEQSQLTARKFGLPESRKIVPNYLFTKLSIAIEMRQASIEPHPSPRDDFDYDYSEPAKVFFEHGLDLNTWKICYTQDRKKKTDKDAGGCLSITWKEN
jgi:hypothetical protein